MRKNSQKSKLIEPLARALQESFSSPLKHSLGGTPIKEAQEDPAQKHPEALRTLQGKNPTKEL